MRESNPRLPARQAGTLATELTERGEGHGGGDRDRTCSLPLARRLLYRVELHPQRSIRSRVPAPPNRCGRFPPSKRELDKGSLFWHLVRDCSGFALGLRPALHASGASRRAKPRYRNALRSSGEAKARRPWLSRRTRHVWCPRRRSLAVRGLPLTRRLLCLLSYEGMCVSTSAVPKRERPVGRGVSLHVA